MKIAFLGHDQLPGCTKPSGGFLPKDAAEALVRQLVAERISRSVIRAFAPGSKFHLLESPAHRRSTVGKKLSIMGELPGLRFKIQPTQAGRYVTEMHHLALRAFRHQLAV